MEHIESGLTIDMTADLKLLTGKNPPKQVNRANNGSPMRMRPDHKAPVGKPGTRGKPGTKSAAKPTFGRTNTTPMDLRVHSEFGIMLGEKLFKNERFEKQITDV